MNPGEIWWGRVGTSLRLLDQITADLRSGTSAVLLNAGELPWRETFFREVEYRRAPFSQDRRMRRETWQEGKDPGAFVLEKCCTPKAQVEYWPGQSYGEYLASWAGEAVHSYDLWVAGITQPEDLRRWVDFVTEYQREAQSLERRTLFFLEYDGDPAELPDHPDFPQIPCRIRLSDCHVFCLEAATELQKTDYLEYQAELAFRIGGIRPEFAAALLNTGDRLLEKPLQTVHSVQRTQRDSQGQQFPDLPEDQINGAAWLASVVQTFPVMEQRRAMFIRKYSAVLARHLPIRSASGDSVMDPWELDIGPLFHIVANDSVVFSQEEVQELKLFRRVRNLLAHNHPAPFQDIAAVLDLAGEVQ